MAWGIGKTQEIPKRVKLRLTRQARNRIRFYGTTSEDAEEAYRDLLSGPEVEGARRVLIEKPQARFADRSLKVISIKEKGSYVVLSVYPLKRVHRGLDHEGPISRKHDIAYIRFSRKKPDGAIEIDEGVVLDTTADNEIVAIEIFDATKSLPVKSLFRFDIAGDIAQTEVSYALHR